MGRPPLPPYATGLAAVCWGLGWDGETLGIKPCFRVSPVPLIREVKQPELFQPLTHKHTHIFILGLRQFEASPRRSGTRAPQSPPLLLLPFPGVQAGLRSWQYPGLLRHSYILKEKWLRPTADSSKPLEPGAGGGASITDPL